MPKRDVNGRDLAAAAAAHGVKLLTRPTSSSTVTPSAVRGKRFGGTTECVWPVKSRCGASGLQSGADVLVVPRTAAFFGPWDHHNFVTRALAALCRGERFVLPVDTLVSATYVPDLADVSLDLLIDGEAGVWHLANPGPVSWFDLARRAAERVGLPTELLQGCATADLRLPALRPLFSALASERGGVMPTLDSALDRYAAQVETLPRRTLRVAG